MWIYLLGWILGIGLITALCFKYLHDSNNIDPISKTLSTSEQSLLLEKQIRNTPPETGLESQGKLLESQQIKSSELLQFKTLVETQSQQIHQQTQLLAQTKTQLIQTTEELNEVQNAHTQLQAKYLKKVTSREEKKQNLAKYRATKTETRKDLNAVVAEIIAEKDKWLPHARETPTSHIRGKKKGGHGGGKCCPEYIHEHRETHVKICPKCQKDISTSREKTAYSHIITEIETIQANEQDFKHLEARNIKIKHFGRWCPFCHKWVYHEYGALKYVRYGLNFIIYVISKRVRSRMTFDLIIAELWEQFGDKLTLSAPAIIQWFQRYEEVLTEIYIQFKGLIGKMGFVHIDETGLPMRGENWWVWVICNAHFALFFESKTRGYQAIEDLMKDFTGAVVTDCWTAYEKLEQEQQKCLGHVAGDTNELLVAKQKENARIEKALLLPPAEIKPLAHPDQTHMNSPSQPPPPKKRGRPKKECTLTDMDRMKIKEIAQKNTVDMIQIERLRSFLGDAWKAGSPIGYPTPRNDCWTKEQAEHALTDLIASIRTAQPLDSRLESILARCEKYKTQLFTYLKYENLPPDNNCAERDLRHFAVQRRISTNFQNDRVMHSYLLYKSLFKTCQKNDKDFALLLKKLLQRQSVDFCEFFFNGEIPSTS